MPVLVFCIIISFMLYLFYKTKYFRTNRQMEKGWLAGKSAMALGVFVALFGANQFFLDISTARIIVGVLFILFGSASIFNGFRQYKHFSPLAIEEAEAYEKCKKHQLFMLMLFCDSLFSKLDRQQKQVEY